MFSGLKLCSLCDLLEKRECSRGQECFEILRSAVVMCECSFYICLCVLVIVVCVHCCNDLIHDIGFKNLHSRKVFHMIDPVFLHIFKDHFIYDTVIKMLVFCSHFFFLSVRD